MKQGQGSRGQTPVLKAVLLWVECYRVALPAAKQLFGDGRVTGATNHTAMRTSSAQHPDRSAAETLHPQKDRPAESSDGGSNVLAIKSFSV